MNKVQFYEVRLGDEADACFAWLTSAEANGYCDPEQLVDVFIDCNGAMMLKEAKVSDLEILSLA